MPSAANDRSRDLTPEAWHRLEEVLERFEDAWRRGGRPDPADYLAFAGAERRALLVKLVNEDLEYRLKAGEPARAEDYLARFPELRGDPSAVVDLLAAEYELRRRVGRAGEVAEYVGRFPEYGPELLARLASSRTSAGQQSPTVDGAAPAPPREPTLGRDAEGEARPELPSVPGYEVLGKLGRGGMGVVYKARQRGLGRLVALKMVLAGEHVNAEGRKRFRAEAEAIARLHHPNIVQIYEVGEHNGQPFFSLEFCPGRSLAEHLAGKPLSPRRAARLLVALARGVAHAHAAGIVHRDLKPENILLQEKEGEPIEEEKEPAGAAGSGTFPALASYTPKISDFGLAKRLDRAARTQVGAIMGTPSYMAPEQAAGAREAVGPATDVYALGAILYEAVTGRPPFRAASVVETLEQVRFHEVVAPGQLQPRLPRDLETICLKCLQKDPARRYASAAELADDLGRFLAGEPIRARPVGRAERVWRWSKRNPWKAAAACSALAALTVLAAATAMLAASNRREREARELAEGRTEEARASLRTAEEAIDTFLSAVTEDPELKEHDFHALRSRLLGSAAPFYKRLAGSELAGEDPRPRRAEALARLAEISQETGKYQEADQRYQEAIDLYRALSADHPEDRGYRRAEARLTARRAEALSSQVRYPEAGKLARAALGMLEGLAGDAPSDPETRFDLARCHQLVGEIAKRTKQAFDAEAHYKKALEVADRLCRDRPGVSRYRRGAVAARESLGRLYTFFYLRSNYREGARYIREAIDLQAELTRQEKANHARRHELAALYELLGLLRTQNNEHTEAEAAYREAASWLRELVRQHPGIPVYLASLSIIQCKLANGLLHLKRLEQAEEAARESVRLQEQLVDRFPDNPTYRRGLVEPLWHLGRILSARGRPAEEILPWVDKASANCRAYLRANEDANTREVLGAVEDHRGNLLTLLKRHAEALQAFDRAIACGGVMVCMYQLARAETLARLGDHGRATAEAAALVRDIGDNPHFGGTVCGKAAVAYSLAIPAVLADRALSEGERTRRAEEYSAEAVALWRRAKDAGVFREDPSRITFVTRSAIFDPLRKREEFRRLLQEIEAEAPGKK